MAIELEPIENEVAPKYCKVCDGLLMSRRGVYFKEDHVQCEILKTLRRIADALESMASR